MPAVERLLVREPEYAWFTNSTAQVCQPDHASAVVVAAAMVRANVAAISQALRPPSNPEFALHVRRELEHLRCNLRSMAEWAAAEAKRVAELDGPLP